MTMYYSFGRINIDFSWRATCQGGHKDTDGHLREDLQFDKSFSTEGLGEVFAAGLRYLSL